MAVWPIVLAVTVTSLLMGLPIEYNRLANRFNWPRLSLPTVNAENYRTFMVTIAQTSAAVLALFFAAVSVVASTAYAKVTTEIRTLVADDDLNRRYLSLLAHTAATATAAVGLNAAGIPESFALGAYVFLLAIICLLAFLPLGIRTFALFDQASLVGYPIRRFYRALDVVTNSGLRWLDPSFQNHARIIAETQLRLIEDLVVFAINNNQVRNDTVLTLIKSTHQFVKYYTTQKASIPSKSLWFPRKAEYRRWQVVSSSMTEITLQTGVAPSPESVPNHRFVEERCADITYRCLQHMLDRDAMEDVVSLLLEVNRTVTYYARLFDQSEAIKLVEGVRKRLVEFLKTTETTNQPLMYMQAVDVACVAALTTILKTSITLKDQPVEKLFSVVSSLLKLRNRRLYKDKQPRSVIRDAEDLMQRLQFERATEGKIITRPWYVRQLIAFAYAEFIREVIKNIVITVDQEFLAPATELVNAKRSLCAGVWLQRGIEACKKARNQIQAMETVYSELKKFHITELEWQSSGSKEALAAVEANRIKIVQLLAKIVPNLCTSASDGNLPDLLGQARAWIADELLSMMERKEEKGFSKLFIAYFDASLAIERQFGEIARKPGKSDYVRAVCDVMVDVMDISGLALLFSELDNTKFGKIVKYAWDIYLKQYADQKVAIEVLLGAIESKLSLPLMSPSAMQRQQWNRRFVEVMVNRGINVERNFGPWFDWSRYEPHHSAVIESINVFYGYMNDEPHMYFAAMYIAQLESAKGLAIPYIVQECIKSIELGAGRQKRATDAKNKKKDS